MTNYKAQARIIVRVEAKSEAEAKSLIERAVNDGLNGWLESTTTAALDVKETEVKILSFKAG